MESWNSFSRLAQFLLCASLALAAGCTHAPSAGGGSNQASAKRYALKGKVVSIGKNAETANIDNEAIAGFMDAMVMSYPIKPASVLSQLQPGDSVTAGVVLAEPGKYWLENVRVTGHSDASGKPAADATK